jgi:hypothetical protein
MQALELVRTFKHASSQIRVWQLKEFVAVCVHFAF